MNIIFMGTPDFAVFSLRALLKAGHEIIGVLSQPDKPKGRGYTLTPPPVKVAAMEAGIPVYQPTTLKDESLTSNDGDDTKVWVGGICASNWGTVKSCTAKDSSLTSNARGDGELFNKAYPFSCVGGIVGEQASGITTACSSSGCTISAEAASGGYTNPTQKSGDVCAYITGGSVD